MFDSPCWSWERGWVGWSRWVWRAESSWAPEASAVGGSVQVTQPAGGCPELPDLRTNPKRKTTQSERTSFSRGQTEHGTQKRCGLGSKTGTKYQINPRNWNSVGDVIRGLRNSGRKSLCWWWTSYCWKKKCCDNFKVHKINHINRRCPASPISHFCPQASSGSELCSEPEAH